MRRLCKTSRDTFLQYHPHLDQVIANKKERVIFEHIPIDKIKNTLFFKFMEVTILVKESTEELESLIRLIKLLQIDSYGEFAPSINDITNLQILVLPKSTVLTKVKSLID